MHERLLRVPTVHCTTFSATVLHHERNELTDLFESKTDGP